MPRVIVFDVNETLLDLSALDPHFERVFGDPAVRGQWFAQLLHNAFVSTITAVYADFGRLAIAALEMVAARRGVELTDDDRQTTSLAMKALPPHLDVHESLERLRAAGFRMATLTNSTLQVAEDQLANAGLRDYFEQVLSADRVWRLKPAEEPYRMAAEHLRVNVDEIRLVAAHAWDITGALRAGMLAAFVARQGAVLDPLVEPPDIIGADLREVTDRILEVDA